MCIAGCPSQGLPSHILNFAIMTALYSMIGASHGIKVSFIVVALLYFMILLIGEKIPEFTRKHVSDMYYNAELENEIRQKTERIEWKFKRDEDRESHLATVLSLQKDKTYQHIPSDGCKERGKMIILYDVQYYHCIITGCEFCYSLDGNWKLTFPHCMFPVKAHLTGLPTLNMPNVCTEQLQPKSAFCAYHNDIAVKRGYPTTVREFLKFCGIQHSSQGALLETYHNHSFCGFVDNLCATTLGTPFDKQIQLVRNSIHYR